MISIGRKLFEEVDMPLESKIVSKDQINKIVEREIGKLYRPHVFTWYR